MNFFFPIVKFYQVIFIHHEILGITAKKSLHINISGKLSGTYSGSIVISATGAANSPIVIPVTLTVYNPSPPSVSTLAATTVTTSSATLNGNLTSLGTASTVNLSLGYSLVPGGPYNFVAGSPATAISINTMPLFFSASVTGLSANTKYYVVAKATGDGGSTGTELNFATAAVALPDFSISATPSSMTVNPGVSSTSTIKVTSINKFSSAVKLTSSYPSGWSASLSPTSVTPQGGSSASSTLTIKVPSTALAGTYQVTVTGTSSSLIHTTVLSVVVPDFSITASPNVQTLSGTGITNYTVTLTTSNGYKSPVSLSVAGLPSGASASFSPSSVTPTLTGASCTLKITVKTRSPGTYTLNITATGGAIIHSSAVTLVEN